MWLLSNESDFDRFKDDLAAVERKVTREFDTGPRAMVVAILVFVVLLSFVLPHTGTTKGFDVLVGDATAVSDGISLPSRVFTWLALVFSVGFSTLALITRRWALAWTALAGSAVASALGMLAVWSRQTAAGHPGPGIGLIIGWLAVIVLTFHWARVVWSRTALQLAAEEDRRREAVKHQQHGVLGIPMPGDSKTDVTKTDVAKPDTSGDKPDQPDQA
ncbi:Rv2732c family membrane protein [Mycolicibacterium sp. XJ775]